MLFATFSHPIPHIIHLLFPTYFHHIQWNFLSCCKVSSHLILPSLTLTYFLCPITLPFNVFYFLFSFLLLLSFVFYYYLFSTRFFHALLLPLSLCYFLLLMLFSTVLLCIIYSTTSSHSLSLPRLIFSHSDLLPFILFCILPPHTITCYSTFCHLLSSFTTFYYLYNFLLLFIIYSTTFL